MRSFRRGLKNNFKQLTDFAPRPRLGSINKAPEKADIDVLEVPKEFE
jgi:hypothetical protein